MRPDITNWALELAHEGFATALIGYTHTALDPKRVAAERLAPRGFQGILPGLTLEAELTLEMSEWRDWFTDRTGVSPPKPATTSTAHGYEWGYADYPFALSETAYLAEKAARYLRDRTAQPWALHVTFFRPHDPYIITTDFAELVANVDDVEPIRADADDEFSRWLRDAAKRNSAPSPREVRDLRRFYYASVAEMDRGVGMLLDTLRDTGFDKDTLVIVTADHGDQLGDHGLMNKLGVYDQSYNVPLIIDMPGAPKNARGRIVGAVTQSIDLVPTVLDCLLGHPGQPRPGNSLKRWLLEQEEPSDWQKVALWGYEYRTGTANTPPGRLYAARTADHLLAIFDDRPPLLINYRKDGELQWRNKADSEDEQHVKQALLTALARSGAIASS